MKKCDKEKEIFFEEFNEDFHKKMMSYALEMVFFQLF